MKAEKERILIVDDEESMREYLSLVLEKEGYVVKTAADAFEALRLVEAEPLDLVVEDLKMPKMDGIELLKRLKEKNEKLPVIIMTAFSTWDSAVQAMRLGAFDYIRKPFDNQHIRNVISRALDLARHLKTGPPDTAEIFQLNNLIGTSPKMNEIQQLIRRVAPTDSTILILGESGVGKELVARAIHGGSLRSKEAFIAVNCAAFNENLLESELFGHLKGAFTGAVSDKKGLLQVADHGTFFLDEIAEMSKQTQVKLLRVLEERQFLPVGGTSPVRVDVRFITATNRDLSKEVEEGRFRKDLFYRLNVISIQMPPLRERKEDIPLLAGAFLARHASRMNKQITGISRDAMQALMEYDWPGNVRELDNTIHRAVALTDRPEITAEDLVGRLRLSTPAPRLELTELSEEGVNLEKHLQDVERKYIRTALQKCDGNITKAARLLKTSFRSLRYRIKKLGL